MTQSAVLEKALAPLRGAFIWSVFFSLCINMLMLTVPLYLLQVFDRVLSSRSTDTLWALTVIAFVALLAFGVLEAVRRLLLGRVAALLDARLGPDLLRSMLHARTGAQEVHSISSLRELTTLRNYIAGNALIPLLDAPWSLIFLWVIFLLHPTLGWLAVAAFILLFLAALLNEALTRDSLEQASDKAAASNQVANSAVQNSEVVSAMGMASGVMGRWQSLSSESLDMWQQGGRRLSVLTTSSKVMRLVVQVVTLATGAFLVLAGELTGGGMIAASILLTRALAPVEQLISSWGSTLAARKAYHSVSEQLENVELSASQTRLPSPAGKVNVENMSYIHPGQQDPILKTLNFRIEAGESIGLIGPSGSGKTTLARLLLGVIQPRLGNLRLDGMNISVWNEEDRGQYIGYMPQDLELFSGTVAENIARLSEASSENIIAAATLAGAHESIVQLPNGYDTQIGENGAALSGGQRQRVALARALFGPVKFVILDEPNANQDRAGEAALLDALLRLKQSGITTIIIAHRPAIIEHVDKILVLRDGRMEAFGPKAAVLAKLAGNTGKAEGGAS